MGASGSWAWKRQSSPFPPKPHTPAKRLPPPSSAARLTHSPREKTRLSLMPAFSQTPALSEASAPPSQRRTSTTPLCEALAAAALPLSAGLPLCPAAGVFLPPQEPQHGAFRPPAPGAEAQRHAPRPASRCRCHTPRASPSQSPSRRRAGAVEPAPGRIPVRAFRPGEKQSGCRCGRQLPAPRPALSRQQVKRGASTPLRGCGTAPLSAARRHPPAP